MDINLGTIQIQPKGAWESTVAYEYLNLIRYNNNSYICRSKIGAPTGTLPTDTNYFMLISTDGINGIDGTNGTTAREIQLRKTETKEIQWKYTDETEWHTLLPFSDLKGDTGPQGPQGENGAAATVPEATETVAGKIAIATESEVTDGAVSTKAVTPATLAKGKAGGVATLDPSGKVPLSQLPITQSTAVEPHTITAFDAAGEPSEITIGTETISISRDANGRLTAIQVGTTTYTAQYDADGRYTGLQ